MDALNLPITHRRRDRYKGWARISAALAMSSCLTFVGGALAADLTQLQRPPTFIALDQNLWVITVTANIQATPRYPGSSDYTAIGYPSISISRSGEARRFSSPDDGISFSLYDSELFHFGFTGRYVPGRYYGDDRRNLYGLRDARFAIEPGLFLEYYPVAWLRTRAEVRHGVFGHHGFVASVGADVIQPFGRWQVSLGPRFNYGDESFAKRYFGVQPFEAALNGGLTAFRPDNYLTVGALGALSYTFNEQWATTAYVGYNRIVGSSADSPLVRDRYGSPNQYTFGLKVNYTFVTKPWF